MKVYVILNNWTDDPDQRILGVYSSLESLIELLNRSRFQHRVEDYEKDEFGYEDLKFDGLTFIEIERALIDNDVEHLSIYEETLY